MIFDVSRSWFLLFDLFCLTFSRNNPELFHKKNIGFFDELMKQKTIAVFAAKMCQDEKKFLNSRDENV